MLGEEATRRAIAEIRDALAAVSGRIGEIRVTEEDPEVRQWIQSRLDRAQAAIEFAAGLFEVLDIDAALDDRLLTVESLLERHKHGRRDGR